MMITSWILTLTGFQVGIFFQFFYLGLFFPICDAPGEQLEQSGAIEVRIPTYNNEGLINWELLAHEVNVLNDGKYYAKNLKMIMLEGQYPSTTAISNSGLFDLEAGIANGNEEMLVVGTGFEAVGKPWSFANNIEKAKHSLAFTEQGKIGFEEEVDFGFLSSEYSGSSASKNSSGQSAGSSSALTEFSKDFPTQAYGRKILILDLGSGVRKFSLDGDVFIRIHEKESNSTVSQFSTISCNYAELIIEKDGDETADEFGKVSRIHSHGRVRMVQPLRQSFADELKWSEESGQINLSGNAKVSHQEWGEVEGDQIVIHAEDGRAEVIAGENGRSRLLLPSINKSKFFK